MTALVPKDSLERAVRRILLSTRSSDTEATLVAQSLVLSNLRGHDSAGVVLLPKYVHSFLQGKLHPNAPMDVALARSQAVIDAKRGFGHVAAWKACRVASENANEFGVAAVAVKNAHGFGRMGEYGEVLAKAGLSSVVLGRSKAAGGTTPMCLCVPKRNREDWPFLLDFAAGAGRHPSGVVLDPPPFGDYKAVGLSFMIELFTKSLLEEEELEESVEDEAILNNMMIIAIKHNPAFEAAAERLAARVRTGPRLPLTEIELKKISSMERISPNDVPMLFPGEYEDCMYELRSKQGIPVSVETLKALTEAAASVGVNFMRATM